MMYIYPNSICHTLYYYSKYIITIFFPDSTLKLERGRKRILSVVVGFLLIITLRHSVVVPVEINHTTVYTKRNHLGVTTD